MIDAKVLADSINGNTGDRIVTLQVEMPKVLLQEFNTHRVFSRNAASSRAIPIKKMLDKVSKDPYVPEIRSNQRGMVGLKVEDEKFIKEARELYLQGKEEIVNIVKEIEKRGLHKTIGNRLLEPFLFVKGVVTSTEWDNFFTLRCSENADPDMEKVANKIREEVNNSVPKVLDYGDWHLPFSEYFEGDYKNSKVLNALLKTIAARCARVSYENHLSNTISLEDDLRLANCLLEDKHLSPFEHAAKAVGNRGEGNGLTFLANNGQVYTRNLVGFYSHRSHLEDNFPLYYSWPSKFIKGMGTLNIKFV